MEFCIQAWSPHFLKDIDVLERVQKAATNLVPMLQKYSYATRLRMIGNTSLEERRLRGDMIEVYKLLTGKEQIDHRHHMASEDTRRNWQKTDPDWIQGNSSLVKEWSMDGTVFRQKSSTRNQLTASRTHTTATTAKIWTTEADQLPVHQPTSTSTSTLLCVRSDLSLEGQVLGLGLVPKSLLPSLATSRLRHQPATLPHPARLF